MKEKNPFSILDISLADARQLYNMSHAERKLALGQFRKYVSRIYHPDISDSGAFAEKNGAILLLENEKEFETYFKQYDATPKNPITTGVNQAMIQQAQFLRKQGEEALARANQKNEYLLSLEQQVDKLQREVQQLRTIESRASAEASRSRELIEKLHEAEHNVKKKVQREYQSNLYEYRRLLGETFFNLMTIDHAKRCDPSEIEQIQNLYLTVMSEQMTLKTVKKIPQLLIVDQNRNVYTETVHLQTKNLRFEGVLIGGIRLEEKSTQERINFSSKTYVHNNSLQYDDFLSNATPNMFQGMLPVVLRKRGLKIFGKIINISKHDGIELKTKLQQQEDSMKKKLEERKAKEIARQKNKK